MFYQLITCAVFASRAIAAVVPDQGVLQLRDVQEPEIHYDVPGDYDIVDGLFEQDDKDTDDLKFDIIKDNFGLKKDTKWSDVLDKLSELNDKSKDEVYKLFFLARHGEGYHNIAPEGYSKKDWDCYWQMQEGNGTMEWYDAELTANGQKQIESLSEAWKEQLYTNGAPFPQSFYVSPMRRCLQTYNDTWSSITNQSDKYVPVIKEFARETYGIQTESRRHDKTYIHDFLPIAKFEDGFTEKDELWSSSKREPTQHRDYRALVLFNDIFAHDKNDVISITAHSGIINSMLKELNHRDFSLQTGQMIPVLVKAGKFGKFDAPKLDKKWGTVDDTCKS